MKKLARMTMLAAALVASATTLSAQQTVTVDVTVDLSRPGAPIARQIYGHFAEHLGRGIYEGIWVGPDSPIPNTNGYRNDVLQALRNLEVPVIRWPGGCFADLYDWRDGIGPREDRPTRINVHWGGVTDNNAFGTHEFMNFTELVGAEAFVSGNLGSMEPLQMGQWVEYMTSAENATLANERRANGREEPWTLKYFGIGNETWGCGGNMRPETAAAANARAYAFVHAPRSMGMLRVAAGASGNLDLWHDYMAFTEEMMKNSGPTFDGHLEALSYHYYAMPPDLGPKGPATGFTEEDWAKQLDYTLDIDRQLKDVIGIMDRYDPERQTPLFVDEWGAWYQPEPGSTPGFLYQQNSLRDAQVAALTFNIFHRYSDRIKMANIAQMINVLQAVILTDGPRMILTPTYHAFDLYRPFMEATPYPATASQAQYTFGDIALPLIDVTAARGTDGRMYLAVVNTDPHRAVTVRTNLSGRSATGRILVSDRMDAHNSFDNPTALTPQPISGTIQNGMVVVQMPPMGVAVLAVD
jgi:alpha-N-arabinofuranosidase